MSNTAYGSKEQALRNASEQTCVCAVCGRVLDIVVSYDADAPNSSQGTVVGYRHGQSDRESTDHPAVPVREGRVPTRGRCDFCNAEDPIVALPVGDFIMPGGGGNNASAGDWAACHHCAPLIAADRWGDLIKRVRAEQRARGVKHPAQVYVALAELYREIALHTTGKLKPL